MNVLSLAAFAALLALHALPARSAPPQAPPAVEAPVEAAPFRWSRAKELFESPAARRPTIDDVLGGKDSKTWCLVAMSFRDIGDGYYAPDACRRSEREHRLRFQRFFNPFEGTPASTVRLESASEASPFAPIEESPASLWFRWESDGSHSEFWTALAGDACRASPQLCARPRLEFRCRRLDGPRLLCLITDLAGLDIAVFAGFEPEPAPAGRKP